MEEVPAPVLEGTGVLVRNAASLISPGTERATVSFARKGLLAKVQSQPERVKLLLRKMKQVGIVETMQLARRKLESPIPMGYSTAGMVLEASPDLPGVKAGDRVACAGARYANHADIVYIPKNLFVPLPDNLSFEEGSFVAPGAIALHGVRLAEIGLGETVLIIGLGLIGQLAAQLVQAQGGTAIGIDLDESRLALARDLGTAHAFHRNDPALQSRIMALTGGRGVDATLVTAATASNDPVFLAGELSRDRAKVVVVGDVGMQVPRNLYYHKELSIVVSRSYGPGRYDEAYERDGQDYPAAYVRWSERDNMAAFLALAAEGRIRLQPLIQRRYPITGAAEAYDLLTNPHAGPQPLGIVLEYPQTAETQPIRRLKLPSQARPVMGQVGLGVIGAGNFASGVLLPLLKAEKRFNLRGLVSHSGLNAKNAAAQAGFAWCATDIEELLNDRDTQAVLVATRHDSHAELICRALEAGKHVFVEKPLATTPQELAQVTQAMADHPELQVMVGFNRRFSPFSRELKQHLGGEPLSIRYRVLAGPIPPDSWLHKHGGRIVGEVCHFIDWCQYISGEDPVRVSAIQAGNEPNTDVAIQLELSGGSIAHITYLMRPDAPTAAALGKERIEVYGAALTAEMDDFKALTLTRQGRSTRRTGRQDKGHRDEIAALAQALQSGQAAIEPRSLLLTTQATFAILESLASQNPVPLSGPV